MDTVVQGNVLDNVPTLVGQEVYEDLLVSNGFRVERIVSTGQVTPPGTWLDQNWNEWVLVLRGAAGVLVENESQVRHLRAGDYLAIPAHCRHRVEWTDLSQPTIWLAIHDSPDAKANPGRPMKYEVEQKFPVADVDRIERLVVALAGEFSAAVEQVDRYFAHPARDFAQTDEALRIRRTSDANRITYKGPKLDQVTKTRREIELPLAPGAEAAEDFSELLFALGFRRVAEVRKLRRTRKFTWQGHEVEAALDEVQHVGNYLELELSADYRQLSAARDCLTALAEELGLTTTERRSYLELLLNRIV